MLLLAVLIFAGAWEGFRFAKLHLALSRARKQFSNSQFMRAEFWAGRALSVDADNVEAIRLMAEINEVRSQPAAIGWRIKLAQREPGNTGDIMAWAKCALRFSQGEMALRALDSLPQDFKDRSAEYHELMAGCAMGCHQPALAEMHFAKAEELDPGNPIHRVDLASFRLANSVDPKIRAAAAADLETALADPRVCLFAARVLLGDAIRGGDHARAQRFADKLRSLPAHNFSDDLSCLEVVMHEPAFQPALEAIEKQAGSDALLASDAGNWLNSHGMAAETLRWFAQMPGAIKSDVRVQMAAAESYLALRDWKGLESFLANCHWPNGEFLRRAMAVRSERELGQPWQADWKKLVSDVNANPPDALLLAQVVTGWNWRDETLELLWGAASQPQTEPDALQFLWNIYSQMNDTRELWRVATEQLNIDPANPIYKNNEAFLTLLLYGASERSERLAREASAANPQVPEWTATYAYALHLAGKEPQAKEALKNLPPTALERPGVALYYAIVLAANGEDANARQSLGKLNPNGMLPEEQQLALNLAKKLNASTR